jgi:hypothetical protein
MTMYLERYKNERVGRLMFSKYLLNELNTSQWLLY